MKVAISMLEMQTTDTEYLTVICSEQSRIALINYDAAQKNHESMQKLLEIVSEQSRQVENLIATVGDLLAALEQR